MKSSRSDTPVTVKTGISLLESFSIYFQVLDKKSGDDFHQSFLQLVDLDDDLTSLLLENAYLDYLHHSFTIEAGEPKQKVNGLIAAGSFDGLGRLLTITKDAPDRTKTLIHELAHAITFFVFKPRQMTFGASVPYAQKQTFFPRTSQPFNPAELKFKHCVLEDEKHLHSLYNPYLFSPEIDECLDSNFDFIKKRMLIKSQLNCFFSHIKTAYEADLLSEKSLAEIFPFYIEIRASLLILAKDYRISKEHALAVLEKHLPKLHAYFETDVKRIIKNRLRDLLAEVGRHYSSSILSDTIPNDYVTNADLAHVIRGFWYERLIRKTGYEFINWKKEPTSHPTMKKNN